MKLHQIFIFIVSLFFTITCYSTTTEVSLTFSIGMYSPITLNGQTTSSDLLDVNYAHRFILYVNNQLTHNFERITATNSIPEGIGYTTTVIYTGSILCDDAVDLSFQVAMESDTDLDSAYDDSTTPLSAVYPLRVPCLRVPQNFIIIF